MHDLQARFCQSTMSTTHTCSVGGRAWPSRACAPNGLATRGNDLACLSLQVCVLNSVSYAEREEKQNWEQHLDKCILLTNTQVSHDFEHACQPGVADRARVTPGRVLCAAQCQVQLPAAIALPGDQESKGYFRG